MDIGTDWQLLCVAFREASISREISKNIQEMFAHQWLIILIFLGNLGLTTIKII